MSCWLIFHRFVILCAASQRRHLVSSVPTLIPLFAFQLIHVLLLFTCTSLIIMRLHEHNTHTIIYVCLWMYEFNIYSVYACVCMNTIQTYLYMSARECMCFYECLCEYVLMCLCFDPSMLSFPSHPSHSLCSCSILCALPSNEANTSTTQMSNPCSRNYRFRNGILT